MALMIAEGLVPVFFVTFLDHVSWWDGAIAIGCCAFYAFDPSSFVM
jgi:hypothetical protein